MGCFSCLKCCWSSASKLGSEEEDSTTLVQNMNVETEKQRIQPLYTPRRHSSYNTDSFNPVLVQPQTHNSDSFSSSEDEDSLPFIRGRCWSAVAANSNTNDIVKLVKRHRSKEISKNSPKLLTSTPIQLHNNKYSHTFGTHALPDLSEAESTSTDSSSTEDILQWENEDLGTLMFSTSYNFENQKLKVFVAGANFLPKRGLLPHYDTFVKVAVTPVLKDYHVTPPVRGSRNPRYDEEFLIHINQLKCKSGELHFLRLSVFDCDRLGRHDAIGHVTVPIRNIMEENLQNFTLKLSPKSLPIKDIGQILLGLSYSTKQSRLIVNVIKGRHLRFDNNIAKYAFQPLNKDSYDTFVKVKFMVGGKKVRSTRSRIVLDSTKPLYQHKSKFVMPSHYVMDSSIVITVEIRGLLGRNVPLGRIIIGPYTETAKGVVTHWGKMLQECKSILRWKSLYI